MTSGGKRRTAETRKAVVYAVLVHLALIAIVVVGMRWQASPDAPTPMQARVVSEADVRKELEQRKRNDREVKPAEPKKKREVVEEKPRPDPAKLNEQKRREDDKRKALEAEKKRKDDARQAEVKKQKDSEERRKAAESSLKEQLAQEEQERAREQASAEAARAQKELSRVEGLIKQKIERNWVRPPGWTQGLECVVRVRLIPTGEAIGATVVRSSGNPAFDRSVENAVYKASPLPLPEDKSLFEHFRELELRFRPEGKG